MTISNEREVRLCCLNTGAKGEKAAKSVKCSSLKYCQERGLGGRELGERAWLGSRVGEGEAWYFEQKSASVPAHHPAQHGGMDGGCGVTTARA